jgi:hypothetical protein
MRTNRAGVGCSSDLVAGDRVDVVDRGSTGSIGCEPGIGEVTR